MVGTTKTTRETELENKAMRAAFVVVCFGVLLRTKLVKMI